VAVVKEVLAALDSREKAVLLWIAFALILALRSRHIRSSLLLVAKTLLSKPILAVVAAMVGYVSLVIFGFDRLGLWDLGMVKDSVIWFLGCALAMVFNYEQAHKDACYFRRSLIASLNMLVVVEFLVNFYVFPIFAELVLVPVLFFGGALLAYSKTRAEYAPVKRLMEFVMAAVGFFLLAHAAARLAVDVTSLLAVENVKRFVLPIALTVLFLPFIYTLALYSAYDDICIRVKLWITDRELARYTRRQVFSACQFRLTRVNRFMTQYAARLPTVKSTSDATQLIADFRATQ
jgi:hypothetical protein